MGAVLPTCGGVKLPLAFSTVYSSSSCLLHFAKRSRFADDVLHLALMLTDDQWHLLLVDLGEPAFFHQTLQGVLGIDRLLGDRITVPSQPLGLVRKFG